jgi:hypothetical protein
MILPFTKLCNQTEEEKPEHKATFTAGVLKAGGSIFGFEFEKQVYRNAGIQIGIGISSLSAGFNFHFKPRLNSSFLSTQYAQQGMGMRFVHDILSVSYVFRAKKNIHLSDWIWLAIKPRARLSKGKNSVFANISIFIWRLPSILVKSF